MLSRIGILFLILLQLFVFTSLSNLTSFTHLTNLHSLNISKNYLTDISALIPLIHLRDLDVSDNQLTDISKLCMGFEGLGRLNCSGNKVVVVDLFGLYE